jgi:hypothetical protein
MFKQFIASAALVAAVIPAAASAQVVTFDGATGSFTSYTESGYLFTSNSLFATDGGIGNGTTGGKINVTRVDGDTFTIASLDVASQVGMMFAGNMDLLFDFTLADGTRTSDYRVIDLGDNPVYQTLTSFAGLELRAFSVYSDVFSGTGQIKIDNLDLRPVTSAVPEPANWALMIGGFGLAGAALRRRRVAVRFA